MTDVSSPPPSGTVGIVLCDGFELLDAFGRRRYLSVVPKLFRLTFISTNACTVQSPPSARALSRLGVSGD